MFVFINNIFGVRFHICYMFRYELMCEYLKMTNLNLTRIEKDIMFLKIVNHFQIFMYLVTFVSLQYLPLYNILPFFWLNHNQIFCIFICVIHLKTFSEVSECRKCITFRQYDTCCGLQFSYHYGNRIKRRNIGNVPVRKVLSSCLFMSPDLCFYYKKHKVLNCA